MKTLVAKPYEQHEKPKSQYKDIHEKHGDKVFADPERLAYPLDTYEHVRAAISYFSMPRNYKKYSPAKRKKIWSRIKKAAKKFGIEISEPEKFEEEEEARVPTVCPECLEEFVDFDTALEHMVKEHGFPTPKKEEEADEIEKELKSAKIEGGFVCPECDEEFENSEELLIHSEEHEEEDEEEDEDIVRLCPFCSKETATLDKLIDHLEKHYVPKPVKKK